jgi:hypothetical protein
MSVSLRIAGIHYEELRQHLFAGDGLEAVALALCGRHRGPTSDVLIVHRIVPVPHEACDRRADRITWPALALATILDEAKRRGFAVVKFHSHTSMYDQFSSADDRSDSDTFASIFSWIDTSEPHGSAVMLPDGRIFGRGFTTTGHEPFRSITVAGTDVSYWYNDVEATPVLAAAFERQDQLFGRGTTERLRRLCIGVVGCSGTGSVVIELLARLGAGTLVLVDDDRVELRNLNRILNTTDRDIGRPKVDVLAEAVEAIGIGTTAVPLHMNLFDPEAVNAIGECDAVFGCMDTVEGRHILNRIAAFYAVPFIDLGVHLASDGRGGIDEASGVIHYLQPGGSSLLSRGAYTLRRVEAENRRRTDPAGYERDRAAGYIEGVNVDRPAVVSVNATIASFAVNEFLARIHPFRSCANGDRAITRMNFMETMTVHESETEPCQLLARHVGRGDVEPLLGYPSLANQVTHQ